LEAAKMGMTLPPDLERKCLELAAKPTARTQWHHHVEAGLIITEKEFMQLVIDHAEANHWLVYHTYDSRRSEPGFPDLLLLRRRLIAVELKSEKGETTQLQDEWLAAFRACGILAYLWRPSDWLTIQRILEEE
jgi:hypothetical protein